MDACVWIACLLICGFFFLMALVIGAYVLVIALIGGGLLLVVIGIGAVMQGEIGVGLLMIAGGLLMSGVPIAILGGGSAGRARRDIR